MLAQLQATAARRASALAEQADSDFELTEPIEEPDETHGQEHDRRVAPEHRQEQKAPPAFRAATREPDVVLEEIRPQPAAPPHAVAGIRRPAAEPHRSLISPATSAAVDSAFNTLAETVLVQNGRTLEDLVREMLRPMLRAWLDDNLPSMVERLVRAEIERVSRGRG